MAQHGTTDLWRPPPAVSIVMSNMTQSVVQSLIPAAPDGVEDFWPRSGHQPAAAAAAAAGGRRGGWRR
eukprot:SAG22_NODE_1017_length_6016_cov_40.662667_12_plen_67_part_01